MTAVLKALWGMVMSFFAAVFEAVRDFFHWLRKPGSKLKASCGVLAFLFATAGVIAFEREAEVKRLANQIVVIETRCQEDRSLLELGIADRDAKLAQIADIIDAERKKLDDLQAENAIIVGDLLLRIEQLDIDERTWRERYDTQPDTCRAAREMLDTACAALGDY